jgi:hypothetical protein
MAKFLTFGIKTSQPLPFILLYNDLAIEQILSKLAFKDSVIYFICKVKKVRFNISTLKLVADRIYINMNYQGDEFPVDFTILNGKIPIISNKSNSKQILAVIEGQAKQLAITPDMVLRGLRKELGIKPELIYIGYSLDPIKRLRRHEKIVKASAEIDDSEEIRIYISSFVFSLSETSSGKALTIIKDIGIQKGKVDDKIFKKYVKMVERLFINYFQTEGLNDNHINMKLMDDPLLIELLHSVNIRFIGGEFDMHEGEYFHFWSQAQLANERAFYFDFSNPQLGYISEEQIMKSFISS